MGREYKAKGGRQKTADKRQVRDTFVLLPVVFCLLPFFIFGCATPVKKTLAPANAEETRREQFDAAQKVVGAMAGDRDMTPAEMKNVARDIRTNSETRSAIHKMVGAAGVPVVKYSPVTGKHYSGDLEYDPETGEKLEILPE